jgi:hypothetical protein
MLQYQAVIATRPSQGQLACRQNKFVRISPERLRLSIKEFWASCRQKCIRLCAGDLICVHQSCSNVPSGAAQSRIDPSILYLEFNISNDFSSLCQDSEFCLQLLHLSLVLITP